MAIVSPAKGNLAVLQRQQPVIRDRQFVNTFRKLSLIASTATRFVSSTDLT
jgi:hypothetical protein